MHAGAAVEISSLQAFIAVSNSGSFSKAATNLHLTQPAISKRIATLESLINVRLFDRMGKQTQLTEAGHTLLPKAKLILSEIEESRRLINNLSDDISGKLTLGTSHHIGLHRLPAVLRQFHRQFPSVSLDIKFTDSEVACEDVIHGELELAVITLPEVLHPRLSVSYIWDDPMHMVCAKSHPLASAKHCSLQELSQHDALLPATTTVTRGIIEKVFAQRKITPKIGMETNYLETLGKMVSIGLGWSALPETLINDDMQILCVDIPSLKRQLGLVQHKDRTPSNAGRQFKQLLLDSISRPRDSKKSDEV